MTTTLLPDDTGLVRTSTVDVRPAAVDDLVAHLSSACDALVAEGGLLSSTVLVSQAAPGAEDAPVRVVHLARWATAEDVDAARAALSPAADPGEVLAVGPAEHDLDLHLLFTTRTEQQIELGADGPATFLISMDADPALHEELLGFNVRDTEHLFALMPGFVSCTLFSDRRRERVFEVVQWESMPHFLGAISTPAFAEHNAFLQRLCRTTDARPYRVVHTAGAASSPPGAPG